MIDNEALFDREHIVISYELREQTALGDIVDKYEVQELTAAQKKKADKIDKMLKELDAEGVVVICSATEGSKLHYYKGVLISDTEQLSAVNNLTPFVYNSKNAFGNIASVCY
jgi:hypothetical protein